MKEERKWTWAEIKQCLSDCYEYDGSVDSWGVKVLYHSVLKEKLRRRLYKKPTLITPSHNMRKLQAKDEEK